MEANPMYYQQSQPQAQLQYVGVGRRFLAILIDTILLGIISGIIFAILHPSLAYDQAGAVSGYYTPGTAVGSLLGLIIDVAYFIILEATRGATLGKMALGLRIVKIDSSPIGWTEAIVRNLLRIIDGLFAYLVGAILIWVSPQRQRLGDRAAKTVVIRRQS